MEINVCPWTAFQLEDAPHTHELPESDKLYVRAVARQMGIGGYDSWGSHTLDEFIRTLAYVCDKKAPKFKLRKSILMKMLPEIERALINSSVGLAPNNNGECIRLMIPPLTEERRKELAKQCKGEAENAKVSVRNARREGVDKLKKAVKDGLPEDEQKNGEEKLQKLHDKYIKNIEDLFAAKEKEIMTV